MTSSPMNDGVALLLERMKTHPEEFVDENGYAFSKWGSLISAHKEHLNPEDRIALTNAIDKLMQQHFVEIVLENLVEPNRKITQEVLVGKTPIQYTADRLKTVGQTPIAGVTQTL